MSLEHDRRVAHRGLAGYDAARPFSGAASMLAAAAIVQPSVIARLAVLFGAQRIQASERSMKLPRLRQVAWLSVCVVVFAAIAPAIAHGIARSAGLDYSELCSASGAKRLAPDPDPTSVPVDEPRSTIHCPFCRLQDYAPALPAPDVAFALPRATDPALPVADVPTPPTCEAWSRLPARAPPRFS